MTQHVSENTRNMPACARKCTCVHMRCSSAAMRIMVCMNSVCAARTSLVHFGLHEDVCFYHTVCVFHWCALWLAYTRVTTTPWRAGLGPVMLTVLHFQINLR